MARAAGGRVGGTQSIRRVVAILRILATSQELGVRVSDIAAQAGLHRSTVHRMLRVLAEEGLAEQDAASRRYIIGQEASLLGLARGSAFRIRALAEPHLRSLCDATDDSVFLTIRSGLDSVCVARKTGRYPIQVLAVDVGARRPLGVGMAGLVLLAFLDDDEIAALIRANEPRLARHRLTRQRLVERIDTTRAKGYAYTDAGVVPGTRAVSVPVRDPKGQPVAAISISTVSARMPAARARELVELMREQARLISGRLGRSER